MKDGKTLREQTLEIAIEYFAIYGLDTPFTIFRQSDIRDITKLMWIIANVTPYSLMLRAHSFKDAENKLDEWKRTSDELIFKHLDELYEKQPEISKDEVKKLVLQYANS